MELRENSLTVQEFAYLYSSTNWKTFSNEQIEKSLKQDLFHVSAWVDNQIVGMGRLVGDGCMYWYVQNLIVLPEFQMMGIGTAIMEHLLSFVRNNSIKNSHVTVGLMCSEKTASFYKKFSFCVRPYETLGPGATLELNL